MKSIILFILLITNFANAAEVDSWTNRSNDLPDSTEKLNRYGNRLMDETLAEINRKKPNCNESYMYHKLHKQFWNALSGEFADYLLHSPELPRIETKIAKSVYKYTWWNILFSYIYWPTWADVININGHLIGTDKFEHFNGTGYRYFKKFHQEKKPIEDALSIGAGEERGTLGGWTSGVVSYGDMTAEFNGMRFWNHVLQKDEDILGQNIGPYVQCVDNKWKRVKEIDWSFYVDDGWDEAINCSRFLFAPYRDRFLKGIRVLGRKQGSEITCPISSKVESVNLLQQKYGEKISSWIINDQGWMKE